MRRKAEPELPQAPLLPGRPAIVSSFASSIFEELDIGASLHVATHSIAEGSWFDIRIAKGMLDFEQQHGVLPRRFAYNWHGFLSSRREGKLVRGTHAGFSDLFAPLGDVGGGATATLVVGPFAVKRSTAAEVLERWHWMTGSQGRLGDPGFFTYLSRTLSTLTLEGEKLAQFQRLIELLTRLLAGSEQDDALALEITALKPKVAEARFHERLWSAAASMVDERTASFWANPIRDDMFEPLGVERLPQHVVVGLLRGREDTEDPVDDAIRRDAFQRACVDDMRKRGHAVVARIGDYGVALLTDDSSTGTRLRSRLTELADRLRLLAKRLGLFVHLGIGNAKDAGYLPTRYQVALTAAERALSRRVSVVHAEDVSNEATPLGAMRRELSRAAGGKVSSLSTSFRRYADAAALLSGYRLDATRAYLEAGFDQLGEALVSGGLIDQPALDELRAPLQRSGSSANTIRELSEVYQRVIADIELALTQPQAARRDRSLRRAIAYIRDHFSEPLTLKSVARSAGFAPNYFSERFAESEGMTFQHYLRKLRVDRARSLLISSNLNVEQVGRLCGFPTRTTFHRAFRQVFRTTPDQCRRYEKR